MRNIFEWFHNNIHYIGILFIFYLFSLLLTPLGVFNTWISPSDHRGYYSITRIDPGDDTRIHAYLRSMVIDGDIDFFNEKGYWTRFVLTPMGYTHSFTYSIGSAILWLPFFLMGHLIAYMYSWLGYNFTTDGYSQPYYVMTAIGSASYFFIGLVLLYDLLCNHFSKWISFLAVNVLWLSTHLPFYVFIRSRMAHANEFFIVTLFLYLWWKHRNKIMNWYFSVLLGATAGLLVLVRFDDLPLLSLFLVDTIFLMIKDYKNHTQRWRYRLRDFIVFILIFSCVVSLAFLCSKIIWGEYSLGGPEFSYGKGPFNILIGLIGKFSFTNLWRIFMAGDKGLFLSFPVWILGLLGLGLWMRREKYLSVLILLGFLFPLILCILNPIRGLEYGIRRLSSAVPLLAFGVAMCFERIFNLRSGKVLLGVIGIILPFWAYIQIIQYKILMEYNHPTFVITAFKNIPHIITKSPELFLRSSSWMKLIFHKGVQLQSYLDVFFLIGFPLLELMILVFLLIICNRIKTVIDHYDFSVHPYLRGLTVGIIIFFLSLLLFIVVCNPQKTVAEIDERRSVVKEVERLEQKKGRSVINLDENQIYQLIAESYLRRQQREEAEKYLKKAINNNPHNYHTQFMLAVIYHETHRNKEASEMYQEVLKINPNHAVTHKNLGILYLNEMKEYDRALKSFRRSIALAPEQEQAAEMEAVIKQLTEKMNSYR